MPFGLPKSLLWFVVTGLVFLLQLLPLTGIFLMFAMAPFWSVLLVNIGFAALAVEACFNPRHIYWLIAPFLYFGGYAGAAYFSHQQFASIDRALKAENAAANRTPSPFDPARHDVIIEKTSYHSGGIASALVESYPLDAVFETNRNFKTAGHRVYRITLPNACQTIRNNPSARDAFIHAHPIRISRRGKVIGCRISGPEDPARPTLRVSLSRMRTKGWLLPATYDTLTLRHIDGTVQILRTGFAAPLSWLPMPVMGCGLNSSAPAWQCSAGFMRTRVKGLGGDGSYGGANVPVIAAALGLAKQSPTDRIANGSDSLPASLAAAITKRLQISSANLELIINDPSVRLNYHDVKGLHDRLDLWRDRIPAMVTAMQRAFDGGHATRERAIVLQDLLNKLSPSDYAPVARGILYALQLRPGLADQFIRDITLERLGAELGVAALSVLEARFLENSGVIRSGALLGICHIGQPAAHLAERIVKAYRHPKVYFSREKRFAAYLTLHRLGRVELAPQVLGEKHSPAQFVLEAVSKTVGPESPAGMCVDLNKWRKIAKKI